MANLRVLNAVDEEVFLKGAGAGTDLDPLILDRTTTVSGTVNVADGGGSLTVDGSVTVVDGGGSLTVDGTVAATQSGTWNVGTVTTVTNPVSVTDNGGSLTVDGTVAVSSSTLPTGASTEATLSSLNAKVTAVNTGAVVISSSALPSGGATAARQDTGNTSLSNIDTKTPALSSGRVPVDGSGVTQPVSGTVAATQSGTWNVGVVEKTMSYATGTAATSGDNTLVSTPGAGNRLVVTLFVIQNESATETTMILKSGATNRIRLLAQSQGDGLSTVFPVGQAWKLAENEALVLNLSGANSCGYSIQYYTEAV